MDLRDATVVDLAAQVRSGERSARELTEAALGAIDAHDPRLNSFIALDADAALEQADAIDARIAAGQDAGALAGIPIGVKDLEAASGFVTTYGSFQHVGDAPAAQDSALVARLRAAGCVVLGKTNTPEHGWQAETDNPTFGPTFNPWSVERSPGGSSGGTGAALAAGLVPLATGSDGGGSIRIPAALCGVAGLKPTQGLVPIDARRLPGSGLLGVKAPMARRARDVAYALDAVVGPHPLDPFSLPAPSEPFFAAVAGEVAPPARVVWAPTMGYEVDREVRDVCTAAVRTLESMGTEVIELDDIFSDDPVMTFLTIWTTMRLRAQGDLLDTPDFERIDPGLADQIRWASTFGPSAFADALDRCWTYSAELADVFEQAPLLLTPTVAGQTPFSGRPGTIDAVESLTWVRFTYPLNLTRYPAGSVNAGFTADGMPVGLQIVAPHRADLEVLKVMVCLEDALGVARVDGWGPF
jgi:aspartyl-tRNA(Asn)/glutamyl-tRNA(Gln) amidotransferase subunit A